VPREYPGDGDRIVIVGISGDYPGNGRSWRRNLCNTGAGCGDVTVPPKESRQIYVISSSIIDDMWSVSTSRYVMIFISTCIKFLFKAVVKRPILPMPRVEGNAHYPALQVASPITG
jgi:hypothetical protein